MQKLAAATRTAREFFFKYLELLLALALAIVVSYLSLTGEIDTKGLTLASAGLLVAIAIALVRERSGRESLVAHIERASELARSDKGWQVLDERLVWDLSGPEGSYAKATAEKELLFTQDEVFSIYEYQYKSPGVVLTHVCEGGVRGQPMADLPIIQKDFPGPEGRVYRLISLQRIWRRGEIMAFRSVRELKDHFCEVTEDVTKEVSVQTASVSMRIVWPPGSKPKALWLERSNGQPVHIPLARLKHANGRWSYNELVENPRLGEKIILRWDW
ncbi:MAG TPA: hypothetical protein VIH71_15110 [Solirubrobacteraceae bacterium]